MVRLHILAPNKPVIRLSRQKKCQWTRKKSSTSFFSPPICAINFFKRWVYRHFCGGLVFALGCWGISADLRHKTVTSSVLSKGCVFCNPDRSSTFPGRYPECTTTSSSVNLLPLADDLFSVSGFFWVHRHSTLFIPKRKKKGFLQGCRNLFCRVTNGG